MVLECWMVRFFISCQLIDTLTLVQTTIIISLQYLWLPFGIGTVIFYIIYKWWMPVPVPVPVFVFITVCLWWAAKNIPLINKMHRLTLYIHIYVGIHRSIQLCSYGKAWQESTSHLNKEKQSTKKAHCYGGKKKKKD